MPYNAKNDMLDIHPVPRAHPQPEPGTVDASAEPFNRPSESDPTAAAEARARIAALHGDLEAGQAVSIRDEATSPAPPSSEAWVRPNANADMRSTLTQTAFEQPAVPTKRQRKLPSAIGPALTALGSFLFFLALFKSPVLINEVKYLFHKPAATTNQVASTANQTLAVPPEPVISIPKINVSAPVVYEPSVSEPKIQKALQGGVVHYGSTAVPGQAGNTVIVGHSSNDWWEAGNFKFVFVLLDKLAPGDTFTINYQSKQYTYQVSGLSIVEPTDLSVLKSTPEPTVTLITCTPPGTSWKRLVVRAKQISPSSAGAALAADPAQPVEAASLPGSAPSLTSQLGLLWHNLTSAIGRLFGHNGTSTAATF